MNCYVFLPVVFWYLYWNRRKAHFYLKFLSIYLYVSFISLFAGVLACFKPFDPSTINLVRYTTPFTNFLFNLNIHISGAEFLDTARGGIVLCNHQYTVDVLVLYNVWPIARRMTVIAKKTIFYIWPFGLASWLLGVAFIDRDEPSKAYETLKQISLLTKGSKPTKIIVFAEGTRNKDCFTSKKMLPFKKGAFKMAVGAQVPITPIVIGPYYFINPNAHYFGSGKLSMKILPPVETTGLTENDVDQLKNKVQKMMQDVYDGFCEDLRTELPKTHPFLVD